MIDVEGRGRGMGGSMVLILSPVAVIILVVLCFLFGFWGLLWIPTFGLISGLIIYLMNVKFP